MNLSILTKKILLWLTVGIFSATVAFTQASASNAASSGPFELTPSVYSDIPGENAWAATYIDNAINDKLMVGYNYLGPTGTVFAFQPDAPITRAEFAQMLIQIDEFNHFPVALIIAKDQLEPPSVYAIQGLKLRPVLSPEALKLPGGLLAQFPAQYLPGYLLPGVPWYQMAAEVLADEGIISPDNFKNGNFLNPNTPITREEAAEWVGNYIQYHNAWPGWVANVSFSDVAQTVKFPIKYLGRYPQVYLMGLISMVT